MILSAVYRRAYIFGAIDVIIYSSRFCSFTNKEELVKILTSAVSILTFKKEAAR